MLATFMLARHARADGMHAAAALVPEGEAAVRELARRLAAEAWRPEAACVSPYLRARQTMQELLLAVAPGIEPEVVHELVPDSEAAEALTALRHCGLGERRLLVVSHMPLVSALTRQLTSEELGFVPGQMVEIVLEPGGKRGRLLRTLKPDA